ncbi:hypothetical protein DFJ74DRAFT_289589 [Hyaloraphidium curvatum]|nr:hypothetical protein DFJ74DRAFT_289589 [Hyaloraphidium curvatum]
MRWARSSLPGHASPRVQCATYGATCTFPGTRRVRYGNSVIGAYLYLTRTGSAVCSQDGLALGANDPAYGYDKQCWIEADVQDAAGSPYTTKDTTVGNVAGGAPGTDLGPAFGLDSVEVLAATIGGSWLLNSGPAKVVRWPAGSNAGAAAYVLARFDLPLVKMVSLNVEVVGGVARAYQTGARYANAPAGVFSADSMSDAATIATFEGAGGIAAYGQYLCTSLTARVSTAPRRLRARQAAGGYFFGDTVKLTATFVSPDLPIFESRLIKLSVGRNVVLRSPAQASAPGFLKRFIKTDLVDSPAGPGAPGALSQLAVNTNFSYTPGADEVVMHITPNMLPRDDPGKDYASLSFLTTDDFDSVTDYTFYATFRIYFDVVTANGGRRRRLYTRDASFPSKGVRQTTSADADARAGMVVPPDPSVAGPTQNPASAPAATATAGGSTDVLAVLAVAVCAAAMVASCCAMGAALLTFRRRERDAGQRAGKDGYGPLKDEMLGSSKMPAWGV